MWGAALATALALGLAMIGRTSDSRCASACPFFHVQHFSKAPFMRKTGDVIKVDFSKYKNLQLPRQDIFGLIDRSEIKYWVGGPTDH